MGSAYSSGPFPKPIKRFVNLEMVQIRQFMEKVDRMVNKRYKDGTLMTRQQFQKCFELSDSQTYLLFDLFDPSGYGRIMSLDIWGAIILASSCKNEDKIRFLFDYVDVNSDHFLGPIDLELLFTCASRGFSRLKGLPICSNSIIKKLIKALFSQYNHKLSETREIHFFDVREFFHLCDALQTYMANLGTQALTQDIKKLVAQRAEILKDIVELEGDIEGILLQENIVESETIAYETERGGDARLLYLNEELVEPKEPSLLELKKAYEDKQIRTSLQLRDSQRQRRMERAKANGESYEDFDIRTAMTVEDAAAFTREDGGGTISGGSGSEGSDMTIKTLLNYEKLLSYRWTAFTPQNADKLVKLDLDLVIDLFESAGIRLTDEEAINCLNSLPVNSLGRHSLKDVLNWLQEKHFNEMIYGAPKVTNPAPLQYRVFGSSLRASIARGYELLSDFGKALKKQRRIMEEITRSRRAIPVRQVQTFVATTTDDADGRIKSSVPHSRKVDSTIDSSRENIHFNSSAVLSSWQRRRLVEQPNKLFFCVEFGRSIVEEEVKPPPVAPEPVVVKKSASPGKSRGKPQAVAAVDNSASNFKSALKKAMKSIIEGGDVKTWGLNIFVDGFLSPENPNRVKHDTGLLNQDGYLRLHPALWNPVDLLEHFKLAKEVIEEETKEEKKKRKAEGKKKKDVKIEYITCGSVLWFTLLCKKEVLPEQAEITREFAHRVFEGIPFDFRSNLYVHVKSEVLELPPEEVRRGPDYMGEKCVPPLQAYDYVVVVALLHDNDFIKNIEDKIFSPANVAITRALWDFHFSINLKQNLPEIIRATSDYEGFESKLFGPQEDELGEEGMNPIRFAKSCRKKRQEFEEAIERGNRMNSDQLRELLKDFGWNIVGTRDVLLDRMHRVYALKISLVGTGEMSEFGKRNCARIFDIFDTDGDGGLNLWEMNSLLKSIGSTTLANESEYQKVMGSNDFLLNENGYLTRAGLCAYYEKFGRLSQDISSLGIGSLNDVTNGEISCGITFDSDALKTLVPLLESNSHNQRYFKSVITSLSMTQDMQWDAQVDKLSDVLSILQDTGLVYYFSTLIGGPENFEWLKNVCTAPGMFPTVFSKLSEILADGEKGFIRELKLASASKIRKYAFYGYDWLPVLDRIIHRMLMADGLEVDDNPIDEKNDSIPLEGQDGSTEGQTNSQNSEKKESEDHKSDIVSTESVTNSAAVVDPNDFYSSFFPNVMQTTNLQNEISILFNDAKQALLALQGAIRVTRKQRESLIISQKEWEKGAKTRGVSIKESVMGWPLHATALYDCIKNFGIDFGGLGGGTVEFGIKLSTKGIPLESLPFPKADGSPCPSRKKQIDKIVKAMHRKAAALAAMERQRERARLAKEQAEKDAAAELERQRRAMDPQILFDEEENAAVAIIVKNITGLRKKYVDAAHEKYLAQLSDYNSMMEYNESHGIEYDDEDESAPQKPAEPQSLFLSDFKLSEVTQVIQGWYDLMETRELRYRIKPKLMLRIATCQNNISMMLLETYCTSRSKNTKQKLKEISALLEFMIDKVHLWLDQEYAIKIAEDRELAEAEARAKSHGGAKNGQAPKVSEEEIVAIVDIEPVKTILNSPFPEEHDVGIPFLPKLGLSPVPLVTMLQNYISFRRLTIGTPLQPDGIVPSLARNNLTNILKTGGSSSSLMDTVSNKAQLNVSENQILADDRSTDLASFSIADDARLDMLGTDTAGANNSIDTVLTNINDTICAPIVFSDYNSFVNAQEDLWLENSSFLRAQTRLHALLGQCDEREKESLSKKPFNIELTPVYLLPQNFLSLSTAPKPIIRQVKKSKKTKAAKISDEQLDPSMATLVSYEEMSEKVVEEKNIDFWSELNATVDEVLVRREYRHQLREAERARLRAIALAEERERRRLLEEQETPEALAAAAKLLRKEQIRKKREKAVAMRAASIKRRNHLYEMIKTDSITPYFNSVASKKDKDEEETDWHHQGVKGITDPFAGADETEAPADIQKDVQEH